MFLLRIFTFTRDMTKITFIYGKVILTSKSSLGVDLGLINSNILDHLWRPLKYGLPIDVDS